MKVWIKKKHFSIVCHITFISCNWRYSVIIILVSFSISSSVSSLAVDDDDLLFFWTSNLLSSRSLLLSLICSLYNKSKLILENKSTLIKKNPNNNNISQTHVEYRYVHVNLKSYLTVARACSFSCSTEDMRVVHRLCWRPNPTKPWILLSPRAGTVPYLPILLSPDLLNAENLETEQFCSSTTLEQFESLHGKKTLKVKSKYINIIYLLLDALGFSCSMKFLAPSPVFPLCQPENGFVPPTGPSWMLDLSKFCWKFQKWINELFYLQIAYLVNSSIFNNLVPWWF